MSEQPAAFACPVAIDDSFGPWVGHGCRDAFDFTLLFEEVILSIPVQSLFLVALLVRVLQLSRTGPKIAPGALRPLKAVSWHSTTNLPGEIYISSVAILASPVLRHADPHVRRSQQFA